MQDVVQGLSQAYMHVPRIGPWYVMRNSNHAIEQSPDCRMLEKRQSRHQIYGADTRLYVEMVEGRSRP